MTPRSEAGQPLRILLSARAAATLGPRIAQVPGLPAHELVRAEDAVPGAAADLALVSREVTGRSTKHEVQPATRHFYDLMLQAPALRWVQMHSAGADRPVYVQLLQQGVTVCNASGANAGVVAQSAVAGLLALARNFPVLFNAQRERCWAPLLEHALPRDLAGQTAVIVGWGPVGRQVAALLGQMGLQCIAVRSTAQADPPAMPTVSFEELRSVLPRADWLVLACPLTDRTRNLVDASALALLPAGARLVNVARGEVVVQADLVNALQQGRLAGAFLDVFEHEPLPVSSPLARWVPISTGSSARVPAPESDFSCRNPELSL